ncbi:hypothetical protein F4824DRAFT_165667 [Ustulina deusta]|nr:hypothetical protein F4824DRAFT_165667 [Ustulina deusta]
MTTTYTQCNIEGCRRPNIVSTLVSSPTNAIEFLKRALPKSQAKIALRWCYEGRSAPQFGMKRTRDAISLLALNSTIQVFKNVFSECVCSQLGDSSFDIWNIDDFDLFASYSSLRVSSIIQRNQALERHTHAVHPSPCRI